MIMKLIIITTKKMKIIKIVKIIKIKSNKQRKKKEITRTKMPEKEKKN